MACGPTASEIQSFHLIFDKDWNGASAEDSPELSSEGDKKHHTRWLDALTTVLRIQFCNLIITFNNGLIGNYKKVGGQFRHYLLQPGGCSMQDRIHDATVRLQSQRRLLGRTASHLWYLTSSRNFRVSSRGQGSILVVACGFFWLLVIGF